MSSTPISDAIQRVRLKTIKSEAWQHHLERMRTLDNVDPVMAGARSEKKELGITGKEVPKLEVVGGGGEKRG
ncbi:hypothetical protein COT86_00850 [Candidatus Collierbacteria bacterium CG10_big_fil_rev_8_21_14_0_10_43_36]|uniref:Uncharacterized protein n=2 Tax=Candidatus Collieribacteriota TaxID=1752725 RepID=A0A2H0DSZ4_9BACT|nr:hypothetical protein [bacterium]PIP85244.1 MAG: hypothetical protein COW83_05395 [Candidatus Collierbacteria bacterium CG22_combo_CG10-13_8_21_14_all_43_12]PIS00017.1 MAG: hypothetical protein COT86_00850 [Candidatus Collierbacteria bacterium CG10_big_fil_rev_8_21_14_0_10_43_36]PIZ24792.1 MAG: hypothetical protein COY48_01060 [Candidatus Collierbacteria bacterium CG_4_10_14_0_8_um_filter_43_86]